MALIEAERLLELGKVESGRYAEARKCYEGALDIFPYAGVPKREGQVLGSLGNVYGSQGQYDQAIFTQALAIASEIGDQAK